MDRNDFSQPEKLVFFIVSLGHKSDKTNSIEIFTSGYPQDFLNLGQYTFFLIDSDHETIRVSQCE